MKFCLAKSGKSLIAASVIAGAVGCAWGAAADAQPYPPPPPPPRAYVVPPLPPGWVGPHYYWHGRYWHHRGWGYGRHHRRFRRYY